MYHPIQEKSVPCWYELSYRESPVSLGLILHKNVYDWFLGVSHIFQGHRELFKSHPLGTFESSSSGCFGYGGAFSVEAGEKSVGLWTEIPKGIFVNKEESLKLYQIGATLASCFTAFGHGVSFPYKAPEQQLLTLMTMCEDRDMHGASLEGAFSKSLADYIETRSSDGVGELSECTRAMKKVYRVLFPDERTFFLEFRAHTRLGRFFFMDCPGNACGIGADSGNGSFSEHMSRGEGYEFSCHNTDSPHQQIMLLAGLAALHDSARKAGF